MNNKPEYAEPEPDLPNTELSREYIKRLEKRTNILKRIYYLEQKLKEVKLELEKFDKG